MFFLQLFLPTDSEFLQLNWLDSVTDQKIYSFAGQSFKIIFVYPILSFATVVLQRLRMASQDENDDVHELEVYMT